MNKKTRYILIVALIVIFGGLIAWYQLTPGKYDNLAICLKEKKVVFYGAFWCPHCQENKKAFGKSAALLPYVECSETNPDASGNYAQKTLCQEKNITGYPTWEFADGSRISKQISPEEIALKVDCPVN
jgi:thiol-disulfide isomerase/thioredoxin